jgi:hypothetical protein
MGRTLTLSPDQQAGKAAFKALAKAFGGQVAVEAETGIRQQKISDMGLANVDEFPTLDLINLLEDRTVDLPGWPHVTSWLCRQRGGVFVPVPKTIMQVDCLMRGMVEIATEMGDVSRAISEAVCPKSDGATAVTPREATAIRAHIADLQRAAAAMDLSLAAIEETQP